MLPTCERKQILYDRRANFMVKMLTEGGVLLLLLLVLPANGQNDTQPMFEQPPPNYIFGNLTCETYNQEGFCSQYIPPGAEIIVNYSRAPDQSAYTHAASIFRSTLEGFNHRKCLDMILPLLCRYIFVTCDPAYNTSVYQVYQPICRHGCDVISLFVCPLVWRLLLHQLSNLNFGILDPPLCDPLEDANGGDIPDCIDTTDGGPIPEFAVTGNCFRGMGRGYSGNVSVTRSGKTCQRWSEQAPHQFILPSSQYPEIAGGHNYCRNPGSRAPGGPWCFTTDRNVRWEYCNVPKCDRGPSCELYTGSICYAKGVIGKDYIFVDSTDNDVDQAFLEGALIRFNTSLANTIKSEGAVKSCLDEIFSLMCFHTFPACDYGHNVSRPRQICRSYCNAVRTGACQSVWQRLQALALVQTISLPDCDVLPEAAGGDAPECFIPFNSTDERINLPSNAETCYNKQDKGELYNGTVNVTSSGRSCQQWDSDTPHFHPLTSLYRPYLEGHNYCRNPEGRGSQPWCYTVDPNVRWEYCTIPSCSNTNVTGESGDNINESGDNINESSDDINLLTILVIAIPILVVVILIILLVIFVIYQKTKHRTSKQLAVPNDYQESRVIKQEVFRKSCGMELFSDANLNPSYVKRSELNFSELTDGVELPQYPRNNIVYISDLGQGNFGVVIKAEAKDIIVEGETTTVAIKVLKEGANDQTKKDFFREAALMHEFNHPNILKLLGVCIEQEPLCMLFEYMEFGDLSGYLRNHSCNGTMRSVTQLSDALQDSLPIQQLVDMCINIAAGLEYLAQHHYVHRDLATRNCLINSDLIVKIADFGLSQDLYATDYCRLGDSALLPIRWMPPEAIMYAKFTLQSDVWSFGVVLWEVFSYGAQPYFSLSNEEVVDYVRGGNVLKHPAGTPTEIYDLMVDCWATEPDDRPTASELHVALRRWNPDISAAVADNKKPYENMAAVKAMQQKKDATLREQLSAQMMHEGSVVSSDGSHLASESSSSPVSDGDVAVPLNP